MSTAHLEIWRQSGSELLPLDQDRLTIGRSADNALALGDDTAVSRLHAVLERFASGWIVRDLGSSNGTFVNGVRIGADRSLHSGDEIRIGTTRIVFRGGVGDAERTVSLTVAEAPTLTRREHEVLVALCRPLLDSRGLFSEPAAVKQIAAELFVTEAAIKQHMANLYDKFDLVTSADRRRLRLANEAIARNAVTVAHLRKKS